MPHGQFRFVNLTTSGKVNIEGIQLDEDDHVTAERIEITIISLADHDKRGFCVANLEIGAWNGTVPVKVEGHGTFALDESVLLIGASYHSSSTLPNPFLWPGFHRIGKPGAENTVIQVAGPPPAP